MRRSAWIRLMILLLLAGVGIFQYIKYRIPPQVSITNLDVYELDGNRVQLESNNNGLVFKFFATWCIDCRRELPEWTAQRAEFERQGIEVVLLSDEPFETLVQFKEQFNLPFRLIKLGGRFKDYGVYTLPTTYWLNGSGELIEAYTGSKKPLSELLVNYQKSNRP